MALQRVFYKGDIFPRYTESDEEWNNKRHEGETPLVTATMEVLGDQSPYAISQNSDLEKLPSDHSCVYEYNWNLGLTGQIGMDWLERLDSDDALIVQLILDNEGSGFSTREIFATLEYFPPTKTLINKPMILKNIFSSGGKLASGIGCNKISSISTFLADVIPSNDQSKWYLNKFDYPFTEFVDQQAYGIEWHISTSLIKEVGARLVGRVGIIFLNAPLYEEGKELTPRSNNISLFARFGLKLKKDGGDKWYDFSMLPAVGSSALKMVVTPTVDL